MEFEVKNNQVEKVLIQGNMQELIGVKSARTFKSYSQSKINHFMKFPEARYTGKDVEMILRGMLGVYERFHGEELEKVNNFNLELEIIDGWKGEGSTEIYKGFDNDFRITQPIKNKTTGIVSKQPHTVKKEDLNRMIRIIKNLPLNEPVSCYEIAERLGYDWKTVWKERTKIYFPKYYFCLKILEKLDIILYGGDGKVTRIV